MVKYTITIQSDGKIIDANAPALERFQNDVDGLIGGTIEALNMNGMAITGLDAYSSLSAVRPTCQMKSEINDNVSLDWELKAEIGKSGDIKWINAIGQFVPRYPISRDALLACIESSSDGIMVTDPYGVILYANKAISQLTGYSKDELIGKKPNVFRSPDQDPAIFQELWDTIVDGRVWRGHLKNRRKDGSEYIEAQSITPVMNAYGDLEYFIATKRDIAHLKTP